jgi:hypothetical protein
MPMKPSEHDKLLEKFWEGETSLNEETLLKDMLENERKRSFETDYFNFLKNQPIAPIGLENEIWDNLPKKRFVLSSRTVRWAAAASVALLCTVAGIAGYQHRQQKLANDFALLEQTLNHVSKQVSASNSNEVLYEDDAIVIVASN